MSPIPAQPDWITLLAHSASPPRSQIEVRAFARSENGQSITAGFQVSGQLESLVWPSERKGGFENGLWKSTCFELFLRAASGERYLEFNVSPSTQWSAYVFQSYRAGRTALTDLSVLKIAQLKSQDTLGILVEFELPTPKDFEEMPLMHLYFATVLEEHTGELSYWAPIHTKAQPDFHTLPDQGHAITIRKDAK